MGTCAPGDRRKADAALRYAYSFRPLSQAGISFKVLIICSERTLGKLFLQISQPEVAEALIIYLGAWGFLIRHRAGG